MTRTRRVRSTFVRHRSQHENTRCPQVRENVTFAEQSLGPSFIEDDAGLRGAQLNTPATQGFTTIPRGVFVDYSKQTCLRDSP